MKGVKSWPENVNARDVVAWASKEFPTLLLLVVAAAERRDAAQLEEHCKEIRRVASRIDGYRRVMKRRWAKEERKNRANQSTD